MKASNNFNHGAWRVRVTKDGYQLRQCGQNQYEGTDCTLSGLVAGTVGEMHGHLCLWPARLETAAQVWAASWAAEQMGADLCPYHGEISPWAERALRVLNERKEAREAARRWVAERWHAAKERIAQ